MESTIIKILEFIEKKSSKNYDVYKILDKIGLKELKPDFESVYFRTLIEYGKEKYPTDFCHLFAEKEVIAAFREKLYENNKGIFSTVANNTFETIYKKKLEDRLIHPSDMDLKQEIEIFKTKFIEITRTTKTPKELELSNQLTDIKITLMKQSFTYQAEKYMHYLIDQFNKEFPDNKYIQQKGELRIKSWKEPFDEKLQGKRHVIEFNRNSKKEYYDEPLDPIDRYINTWINDDKQNFLAIMGEYGTGKTSLCKHIAGELAKNYFDKETEIIEDKQKRIVILLNLRNFRAEDVEKYIIAELNENGIQDFNKPELYKRIDNKELIFIFDGFDEMTQKIDTEEKKANFLQIEKLISKRKNSKVILTSREEYFTYDNELNKVFKNKDNHNYQIIHLNLFDNEQIESFIKAHTDKPKYYLNSLKTIYDLRNLAPRPVLLDFIVKYLKPLIEEKEIEKKTKGININASDLYRMGIQTELEKKSREVTFLNNKLPTQKRLALLEKLSIWMYKNHTLMIDTRVIKETLNLYNFFDVKEDYEIIKYLNMFLNFTFLTKESDYVFRISHKSFRDYLVASQLVKEINNNENKIFGKYQTSEEINHFISEMQSLKTKLEKYAKEKVKTTETTMWQKSNAVNVLLKMDNRKFNGNQDFNKNEINLMKSNLTNISALKGFKNFTSLLLYKNQIIDIKPLKEMRTLTRLSLFENQIIDLEPLKNIRGLTSLYLDNNLITDIEPLKELKILIYLDLGNNKIIEIKTLKELKNLNILRLHDNQISDLKPLRNLKKLARLYLNNNLINDTKQLIDISNLEVLDLSGNPLKESQIIELRKKLPQTKIIFTKQIEESNYIK
jgi:KaiC/GvpD/RAD55 family RecA-like ATPase